MNINEPGWNSLLKKEFSKPYFKEINQSIKSSDTIIYPPEQEIFKAFELCPLETTKVVILGQDPYHNPKEAMGLSFSVPKNIKVPPSLKNIFKEIHSDLGITPAPHGDLSSWAKQGVLLLNAILTVEHKRPASHRKLGWQAFTNTCITLLSEHKQNLVFMLWGNFAKEKKQFISGDSHLILEASHPSPLARGAFFGSKHFSQANHYLEKCGTSPIDWSLPQLQLF
jgi:uracil-DNA glycosylase